MLHIFPKTRVYDNSNGMRNIFLLLTQAAQFQFLKSPHFFLTPFNLIFNDLLASQVLSQLGHFTT